MWWLRENCYKKQSEFNKSKSGQVFCSNSCSVSCSNKLRLGANHPLWNNGLADYRELAFRNLEPKCAICEYNVKEILQVHHIDRDRLNNSLNNLIILCRNHHSEIHLGFLKMPTQSW